MLRSCLFGAVSAIKLRIFLNTEIQEMRVFGVRYFGIWGCKPTACFCIFISDRKMIYVFMHEWNNVLNVSLQSGQYKPGAEVLERSPDGETGASNLDRLQHAGVSELVQNHRLVEMIRHLEADSDKTRGQQSGMFPIFCYFISIN